MSQVFDYQVEAAMDELSQSRWINKWAGKEAMRAALEAAHAAKPPEPDMDKAVKAASKAMMECITTHENNEPMREALTAALPYLTGYQQHKSVSNG